MIINKIIVKHIYCLLFLFLFFSCSKKEVKTFYDNGNLFKEYEVLDGKYDGKYIEYYKNGKQKKVSYFDQGVNIDSTICYNNDNTVDLISYYRKGDSIYEKKFKDNKVDSEGYILKTLKVGKWKYFSTGKEISKILEYVNLCDKQYLNQGWYFDKVGDTINNKGNWLEIKYKKKISINEEVQINFKYFSYLTKNPTLVVCFSTKIDEKFCNLDKVKLDTMIVQSNKFETKFLFDKKGTYNLRGFIEEHNNLEIDNIKDYKIRRVYFDRLFIVK